MGTFSMNTFSFSSGAGRTFDSSIEGTTWQKLQEGPKT